MGYRLGMTDPEQKILTALRELERAVASMAAAQPKPNLLPLFAQLDELTAQLPRATDPSLLLYHAEVGAGRRELHRRRTTEQRG